VIPLKDERIAIQLLVFILGIVGILALSGRWPDAFSKDHLPVTKTPSPTVLLGGNQSPASSPKHKSWRWLSALLRGLDRFLRVIHALFAILFMAGGISLALTYRYDNPSVKIRPARPTTST